MPNGIVMLSTVHQQLGVAHYIVAPIAIQEFGGTPTVIRVGELFRDAIRRNCSAIIVAYSHPSDFPDNILHISIEDVACNREIVQAGKSLDCDVVDHLIIGAHNWVSTQERGLGF